MTEILDFGLSSSVQQGGDSVDLPDFCSDLSWLRGAPWWLCVCIDTRALAPAGLKLGVWWWDGAGSQSCVTSQTRWSLHLSTLQVTGCQAVRFTIMISQYKLMCHGILHFTPDIISGTSKWIISVSGPSAQLWSLTDGFHFIMKVIGWKAAHYYSIIWSFGCLRENLSKLGDYRPLLFHNQEDFLLCNCFPYKVSIFWQHCDRSKLDYKQRDNWDITVTSHWQDGPEQV